MIYLAQLNACIHFTHKLEVKVRAVMCLYFEGTSALFLVIVFLRRASLTQHVTMALVVGAWS